MMLTSEEAYEITLDKWKKLATDGAMMLSHNPAREPCDCGFCQFARWVHMGVPPGPDFVCGGRACPAVAVIDNGCLSLPELREYDETYTLEYDWVAPIANTEKLMALAAKVVAWLEEHRQQLIDAGNGIILKREMDG